MCLPGLGTQQVGGWVGCCSSLPGSGGVGGAVCSLPFSTGQLRPCLAVSALPGQLGPCQGAAGVVMLPLRGGLCLFTAASPRFCGSADSGSRVWAGTRSPLGPALQGGLRGWKKGVYGPQRKEDVPALGCGRVRAASRAPGTMGHHVSLALPRDASCRQSSQDGPDLQGPCPARQPGPPGASWEGAGGRGGLADQSRPSSPASKIPGVRCALGYRLSQVSGSNSLRRV